jgi:hypothetical protein
MTPNTPAVKVENALITLEEMKTPEAKAVLDYVTAIQRKNIAVLGVDEAFVLTDGEGQIKAFKSALTLSANEGTLIQPVYNGPFVMSAQGYEVWAEKTGTSVIFPKEVLVGTQWFPNPYAERDPDNRRILAVHARAVAFKFSSMGIPQVSDWTTIFDTPSYRMIDLLAKAKKTPQAFKLLPANVEPEKSKGNHTWASYPFDESTKLWVNTSHDEVIGWYSTILNREKKAMDFAQTFAKRNALKHLSGLQKAPGNQWTIPVLAWRPTGNNVVKWDATQYSQLQDRVAGIIEGDSSGFGDNKIKQLDIKKGLERASDDENFQALEDATDPEDQPEVKRPAQEEKKEQEPPQDLSKEVMQTVTLAEQFPEEYKEACLSIDLENILPELLDDAQAVDVCKKISSILDTQAAE